MINLQPTRLIMIQRLLLAALFLTFSPAWAVSQKKALEQAQNPGNFCNGCDPNVHIQPYLNLNKDGKMSGQVIQNQGMNALFAQCNTPNPPPHCRCASPNPLTGCHPDNLGAKDNPLVDAGKRVKDNLTDPTTSLPTQVCSDIQKGPKQTCAITNTLIPGTLTEDLICRGGYSGGTFTWVGQGITYHAHGAGSHQVQYTVHDMNSARIIIEANAAGEDKFGCTRADLPGQVITLDLNSQTVYPFSGHPSMCNDDCGCYGLGGTMQVANVTTSYEPTTSTVTVIAEIHLIWDDGHLIVITGTWTGHRTPLTCYWGAPTGDQPPLQCAAVGPYQCVPSGPTNFAKNETPGGPPLPTTDCTQQQAAALCLQSTDESQCASYQSSCSFLSETCLDPPNSQNPITCRIKQRTYQCGEVCIATNGTTDSSMIKVPITDAKGTTHTKFFNRAAVYIGILDEAAKDAKPCATTAQAENCTTIFNGTRYQCTKTLLDESGCQCNKPANIPRCDAEQAGFCHDFGEYMWIDEVCMALCAGFSPGACPMCFNWTHSWCCYKGILAKIIQEQGRAQIGLDMGTAENPQCGGLSITQLKQINFSKLDFTQFLQNLPPPPLPVINGPNTPTNTPSPPIPH